MVFKCILLLSVAISIWASAIADRDESPSQGSLRTDSGHLPVYLPEPLRMIAEKAAKGEEIRSEDLPKELRDLIADIEAVCEFDRKLHQMQPSRTGRGLLASLHWLTNTPFAFYSGSGTLSSMQSLTILGRIINSALRLDYGPVRSQGATTMMPAADGRA